MKANPIPPGGAIGWFGQETMTVLRSLHVRRMGDDRGASLVEFALLAPVFFALLLGMLTGGLALAKQNSMANAVREGGRLGATLPEGAGWDSDWAVDVRDRVVAVAGGDVDPQEVCVQVIDVGADPDAVQGSFVGAACPLGGAPPTPAATTTGCLVKVWARTTADLDTIFFSRQLVLESQAVGVYERPGECP